MGQNKEFNRFSIKINDGCTHKTEVHEETGVLSSLWQVGQKDSHTEHQNEAVLTYLPQRLQQKCFLVNRLELNPWNNLLPDKHKKIFNVKYATLYVTRQSEKF